MLMENDFMYQTSLLILGFCCVAHLYDINPVQLSLEVQMIVFAAIGIEG